MKEPIIMRILHVQLLPLAIVLLLLTPAVADDGATIAGRTIEDYASQIDDEDRVVRLRAVKSLGAFGAAAGESLNKALGSDDKAVQYTAAVALGRIGGKPLDSAKVRLKEISNDKDSLAVRLAAAFALCRAGELEKNLPTLAGALTYPERGMVCCAAELLGMLAADAEAAIEPLETVYEKNRPGVKGGDYHIGGAAMNALRKIKGE